jgi:hypothetical protein
MRSDGSSDFRLMFANSRSEHKCIDSTESVHDTSRFTGGTEGKKIKSKLGTLVHALEKDTGIAADARYSKKAAAFVKQVLNIGWRQPLFG